MQRDELIARVRAIVEREIQIPADELQLDARLGDFELDSLDVMKLALAFERAFGIKLAPAEVAQVETFGDVVDSLAQKLEVPA
jgi:acyl carrier protein